MKKLLILVLVLVLLLAAMPVLAGRPVGVPPDSVPPVLEVVPPDVPAVPSAPPDWVPAPGPPVVTA